MATFAEMVAAVTNAIFDAAEREVAYQLKRFDKVVDVYALGQFVEAEGHMAQVVGYEFADRLQIVVARLRDAAIDAEPETYLVSPRHVFSLSRTAVQEALYPAATRLVIVYGEERKKAVVRRCDGGIVVPGYVPVTIVDTGELAFARIGYFPRALTEYDAAAGSVAVTDMSAFDCPICTVPFPADRKIYQCDNGHSLCAGCQKRIAKKLCPYCRAPLSGRRNYALEKVAAALGPRE